jgi:stearoyl-CoA desaturase (delta-9 desaturase)
MAAVSTGIDSIPDGTTDYVPLRKSKYDIKKPHISETPITLGNWYKHVNWLNTILIVIIPIIGIISAYWVPAQKNTLIFAFVYYFYTGLGITAGKLAIEFTLAEEEGVACLPFKELS